MEILIYKDFENFPTGDNPKVSSVFLDDDFLKSQKGEIKSFLIALSEINTQTVAHVYIEAPSMSIVTSWMVRFLITSTLEIDETFASICGLYHYGISGNYVADVDGVFLMNHEGSHPDHKKRNKNGWKRYFLEAFELIRKEKEKEMVEIKKYLDSLTPV